MTDVLLNWHLGHSFGWGIVGLNLFAQWAYDPVLRPVMGHPIVPEALGPMDPLRWRRLWPIAEHANARLARMLAAGKHAQRVDAVVIDALGNGFNGAPLAGRRTIARCVFENTDLREARAKLARYDALLTASSWNAALLEAATGRRPKVVHEGVDVSLFTPGPKSGVMGADAFYVYSGGKVELRKGQDLTLLAFRRFRERHPEAILVTAWQSMWPHLAAGFQGRLDAPVNMGNHGLLDIRSWVATNGIDPNAVVDLGHVPNAFLPGVLREMHVALQPSRAEACTNLPVKEAMACGVPVIAAANTGMRDLLTADNCLLLTRQSPLADGASAATEGWGESDVDEIVAGLEFAYAQREVARAIGLRAREHLIAHQRTWQAHAQLLKEWLLAL